MLNEILRSINNYFVMPNGEHIGRWTIEGGNISLPFLKNGQYFRIVGSVFNDGVYNYSQSLNLVDEEFDGFIYAMAVPTDFLKLCNEIEEWNAQYGDKILSPYQSESFGGYSYTKADLGSGAVNSWSDVFKTRLRPWRKL